MSEDFTFWLILIDSGVELQHLLREHTSRRNTHFRCLVFGTPYPPFCLLVLLSTCPFEPESAISERLNIGLI